MRICLPENFAHFDSGNHIFVLADWCILRLIFTIVNGIYVEYSNNNVSNCCPMNLIKPLTEYIKKGLHWCPVVWELLSKTHFMLLSDCQVCVSGFYPGVLYCRLWIWSRWSCTVLFNQKECWNVYHMYTYHIFISWCV